MHQLLQTIMRNGYHAAGMIRSISLMPVLITWTLSILICSHIQEAFLQKSEDEVQLQLVPEHLLTSHQEPRTRYFPKSVEIPGKVPQKENVWVFILAGQSNMAGRGLVEPQDTIPNERILTIDDQNRVIVAKEPLHFYEPAMAGLDCGHSFGNELLQHVPDSVSLLILPSAVGGSSIEQWVDDSTHRNVQLLTNFRQITEIGQKIGSIKGILWHQGESDAHEERIDGYRKRLDTLFTEFRTFAGDPSLPILAGELGSFSDNDDDWRQINHAIRKYAANDPYTAVVSTADLKDKGDRVHFDSEGQRIMGRRFADIYLDRFMPVGL